MTLVNDVPDISRAISARNLMVGRNNSDPSMSSILLHFKYIASLYRILQWTLVT